MLLHDWSEFESADLSETTEEEISDQGDVEICQSGPVVGDVIEIGFLSEIVRLFEQRNEHDDRHSCDNEKERLSWSLRVDLESGIPVGWDTLRFCTAHCD